MIKTNSKTLLSGAVAGILVAASAHAADATAPTTQAPTGKCIGANACKAKSECSMPGANGCAGSNACKGKGWITKSKAECDAMAKKNKKIKFKA